MEKKIKLNYGDIWEEQHKLLSSHKNNAKLLRYTITQYFKLENDLKEITQKFKVEQLGGTHEEGTTYEKDIEDIKDMQCACVDLMTFFGTLSLVHIDLKNDIYSYLCANYESLKDNKDPKLPVHTYATILLNTILKFKRIVAGAYEKGFTSEMRHKDMESYYQNAPEEEEI